MSRTAVAAVVIAIVAAFTAITVSLVHARRPIDGRMSKSFDVAVPKHFGTTATVRSGGCHRRRPYYYECSAAVHPRHRRVSAVYWRVLRENNGCWTAFLRQPVPAPAALGAAAPRVANFRGCGA
jgi:hypothetical protein